MKFNLINIDIGKNGKWFYKSIKLFVLWLIFPTILLILILFTFYYNKLIQLCYLLFN